jgi:hypothetical protein
MKQLKQLVMEHLEIDQLEMKLEMEQNNGKVESLSNEK